ncbi:MAG: flavodoxin domain-containing protein [Gordonibacter sp.]|uniref:flavodoxin domain-containing protein n=1 Tax=Gordonibacter sp. TaxID=1968902 RepID=UPI002FCBB67C
MKAVVMYRSNTGFTRRYATWIAEELGCEAIDMAVSPVDVGDFDVVVFGSWFHAALVPGSKECKHLMAEHPDVPFVVFVVGATKPEETEQTAEALERTYPKADYPDLPRFYLRGGFDYPSLSFMDKMLMKMMFKELEKKAASGDADAAEGLAGMREGFDATDREAIGPLVACVKELAAGRACR